MTGGTGTYRQRTQEVCQGGVAPRECFEVMLLSQTHHPSKNQPEGVLSIVENENALTVSGAKQRGMEDYTCNKHKTYKCRPSQQAKRTTQNNNKTNKTKQNNNKTQKKQKTKKPQQQKTKPACQF
jgi:hypothetical protein